MTRSFKACVGLGVGWSGWGSNGQSYNHFYQFLGCLGYGCCHGDQTPLLPVPLGGNRVMMPACTVG